MLRRGTCRSLGIVLTTVAIFVVGCTSDSIVSPDAAQLDPAVGVTAASQAAHTISPVVRFSDMAVVGTSKLTRNDNGVSMSYSASELQPGTIATIWWVVYNNPDACTFGTLGKCAGPDLQNPDVRGTAFYAAGHVIGGSGKAQYGAHLPSGRVIVDPDPDANQVFIGNGILEDARTPEIHLVLRTHGEKIPGMVNRQLSTHDAGCTTAPPALQGPNTCMNLLFSIHMP